MIKPAYNKVLLTNADTLKKYGYLIDNLDETRIPLAIKYSQDTYIQTLLGTKLYSAILEEKYDELNADETLSERISILLDNYILNAIGYFVEAELLIPMQLKLTNKGVVNTSDENVSNIDISEIKYTIDYYKNRGESYLDLMKRYIIQNIGDYPEYNNVDSNDIQSSELSFKNSLYLGGSFIGKRKYTGLNNK